MQRLKSRQNRLILSRLIGDISSDYSQFINAYGKKFRPFITELKNIRKTKETDEDGKIDFNSLSESEQKTLHLAWLMGQVYYQLLQSPILDDENKIDRESQKTLITAKNSMKELQQKTFRMDGEMTALYLDKILKDKGVLVTRLAHGLPMGASLDYADELTLIKALDNRRKINDE